MKILFIADILPSKNHTSGLLLERLLSFLPPDSAVCFAVLPPRIKLALSPLLETIPYQTAEKPRDVPVDWHPWQLRYVLFVLRYFYLKSVAVPRIARTIACFGQAHRVDHIHCTMQGPVTTLLAKQVAKKLQIPLLTHVNDPPDWWLMKNRAGGLMYRLLYHDYEQALRSSQKISAISWNMAEEYARNYAVETVPMLPALDRQLCKSPAQAINPGRNLVIGMAGQLYASQEWDALLAALDSVDWTIAGRRVKIRLLSSYAVLKAHRSRQIEFLGWLSQQEALQALSETDFNYCPYRFGQEFETEVRLCFPTKLVTYLAAGRPVLFHGPDYSSPASFLEQYGASVNCYSLLCADIIRNLERLVTDNQLYTQIAKNAHMAFQENFTLQHHHRSFAQLLSVEEGELLPVDADLEAET